jgi:hypothetical protein
MRRIRPDADQSLIGRSLRSLFLECSCFHCLGSGPWYLWSWANLSSSQIR